MTARLGCDGWTHPTHRCGQATMSGFQFKVSGTLSGGPQDLIGVGMHGQSGPEECAGSTKFGIVNGVEVAPPSPLPPECLSKR